MAVRRRLLFIVISISFIFLVPWLGLHDITTRGEGREALVAQSILKRGNWVLPNGYGGVLPSKPPLLHWAAAIVSGFNGHLTEYTARFPSAITSVLFLLGYSFFLFGRGGFRVAITATFILLTSVEWFRYSVMMRVDLIHSVLVASGLLSVFAWYEKNFEPLPVLPIFFFSLATLTKGPVSLLLPALIIFIFMLVRKFSLSEIILSELRVFFFAGLFAAIWYILAINKGGLAFWHLISDENFGRFVGTLDGNPHKHSMFYLLVTLILGFLPWSIVVGLDLIRRLSSWIRNLMTNLSGIKEQIDLTLDELDMTGNFVIRSYGLSMHWLRELRDWRLFSVIVIIVTFIFYSFPEGKRSVYLLPSYPFAAYFLAEYLLSSDMKARAFQSRLVAFLGAIFIFFNLAAIIAAFLYIPTHGQSLLGINISSDLSVWINLLSQILKRITFIEWVIVAAPFAAAGWLIYRWINGPKKSQFYPAFFFFGSLLFMVNIIFFPKVSDAFSPRAFAQKIGGLVAEEPVVYSFENEFYSLSFYLGKKMSTKTQFDLGDFVVLYRTELPLLESALPDDLFPVPQAYSDNDIVEVGGKVVLVEIRNKENEKISS